MEKQKIQNKLSIEQLQLQSITELLVQIIERLDELTRLLAPELKQTATVQRLKDERNARLQQAQAAVQRSHQKVYQAHLTN